MFSKLTNFRGVQIEGDRPCRGDECHEVSSSRMVHYMRYPCSAGHTAPVADAETDLEAKKRGE